MMSDPAYSKPRICRIQVDPQIYPSNAKIRLMRREIKGCGKIVREILSEICEDQIYARFTAPENRQDRGWGVEDRRMKMKTYENDKQPQPTFLHGLPDLPEFGIEG